MRDFNDADRQKKQGRIQTKENPCGLSADTLSKLEQKVKTSAIENHLPCGTAFKIAQDAGVPKIAVGERVDRLGIRITNCQIGCFKVDKNIHDGTENRQIDEKVIAALDTLNRNDALNCASVFELAQQVKITPMAIANAANARNLRIHHCQLGCF